MKRAVWGLLVTIVFLGLVLAGCPGPYSGHGHAGGGHSHGGSHY
jgi:hypothetical protein